VKYDLIAMIEAAFTSGDKRKIATARKIAKEAGYVTDPEWHALVGKVLYGPELGLTGKAQK
jgi:hypothetical protein